MSQHQHCANTPYNYLPFAHEVAKAMYGDPKSLVHGICEGGLAESGIREHSNEYEDRGPKLPDGTYDHFTIIYNRLHAAEMVAQYLLNKTTPEGNITLRLYTYASEDDREERILTGRLSIDAHGQGSDYEMSHLRFRIGTGACETCIELTLHGFGYKFEAHQYEWVISHLYDAVDEYDFHDFMLSGGTPKYDFFIE